MKTVLVTGITRGIGRGIAEKFLENGFKLYGTFNSHMEEAEELVEKYGADRVQLFGPFDFTKLCDVEEMIAQLKQHEFDSIICNAGMFSENDDFNSFNLSDFNETMNCNFYTPMMICIELKDNIKENGSIVLMSSNDAYPGAFSSISYSVSKSAIISLMKCLCVNFGNKKVRVNSVAPGAINTAMNTDEQMNIAPYFTPLSRVGQPIDVAKVVYFLSSDESSFINGENITIDGGYNIVSVLLKSEATPELSHLLQGFISGDESLLEAYLIKYKNDEGVKKTIQSIINEK